MNPVKVVIVDDSRFTRGLLSELLSTDNGIRVVGEAENGREAVDLVRRLKPDIVTMDIHMPIMDGIAAIEQIMAYHALPILVVTSSRDADLAFRAISHGALEVMEKPDIDSTRTKDFINRVKLLSNVRVISHIGGRRSQAAQLSNRITAPKHRRPIIALAASTGGPKALSALLAGFPASFPAPVVIAQHMADDFVPGMAKWLNEITAIRVKTAEAGESLLPGTVYLSPSECHMEVNANREIQFRKRQPTDIYFPSCDILLESVADHFGPDGIGVVLTGMGTDGVFGLTKIKQAGGVTIAQDQASSVVFGMPKAAIDAGCIDRILPLAGIRDEITKLMGYRFSSS
jgi:two-component system chemotaxis response regulator CheB